MMNRIITPGTQVRLHTWMILLALLYFVIPATGQVKIYVNTDLEGISGVYKFAQTREKDTPLNIQACEYFMGDLAAVIRGLRDGGAAEIVVLDGHGTQALLPHLMVSGATAREAKKFFGNSCVTVSVKKGIGREGAIL